MSGLYNMVFGVNPMAAPLLMSLNINHTDVPRFRDCFLSEDGKSIIVYTRTGGGNREEYAEANEALRQIPGFLRDEDDSFDPTYALFHYAVPADIADACSKAVANGWGVEPAKRWANAIDALTKNTT